MNEELKVIISAEVAKFKQGMEDASKQIKSFKEQVDDAKKNVDTNIKNLGEGIKKGFVGATAAVSAAGVAIFAYAKQTAATTDAIDKNSQKLGLSRKAYQELDYILSQNGASISSFGTGMKTLTANMDSARAGTGDAADAFAKLGVSVVDANGNLRSQEETLYDVIRAFQNMEDGTEKSRLATELFGKQGQELLPLLNAQAGSFDELAAKANEYGLVLDDDVIDKGVAMNDTIDTIQRSLKSIWTDLGGQLLPIVQQVLGFVEEHMPQIQAAISAAVDVVSSAIGFIQEHLGLITAIGVAIGIVVAAIGLYNTVAAVKAAMDAAQTTALMPLIAAKLADAAATMAALAPYIAIVAAIAAVIAIIVLCVKHWDEIKEACAKAWNTIKEKTVAAVNAVKDKFNDMKEAISDKVNAIKEGISEKYNAMKETMSNVMQAAKDTVSEKLNNMKQAYEENGGGMKGAVAAAMEGIKGYYTAGYTFINNLTGGKLGEVVDKMKSKMESAKSAVSSALDGIKNKFSSMLDSAKSIVSSGLDRIKSCFNFSWSLPKIKLPHFSISGSFSLNPPSIPHFSVSWYKLGGIFDSPTLFPFGNGQIGGLGEDGAEAIVPLEKNTQWLDRLATMLNEKQGGNRPIYLMVDGKVFGEVACESINDLTRMRGSIPLVLV